MAIYAFSTRFGIRYGRCITAGKPNMRIATGFDSCPFSSQPASPGDKQYGRFKLSDLSGG